MRDEDSIVVLICAVFVFWVLAIGVYFFSDNIRDLLGIDNRTSATVETQTQAGLAKIGVEKHTEKTQSDSEVKKKETTVKQISPTKDVEPVITSDVEPVIEKTEHDIMVEEGWALEYDESDYANKTIHWLFNDQFCRESIAYSYDHLVIVDDKYATWRGSPVQYKDIQLDYIMCYYFNDETLAEVCTLFFAPRFPVQLKAPCPIPWNAP